MKLFFPAIIVFFLMSFQQDNTKPIRLFEEGFETEFDIIVYHKGKETSREKVVNTYSNSTETDEGYLATVNTVSYYSNGEKITRVSYIRIENDTLYSLFSPSDNLMDCNEFPLKYKEGLQLRNITMKIKIESSSGIVIGANRSVTDNNRKIVGKESLKTDAGEFECYKVTGESSVGSQTGAYALWFSPELGVIQTEVYDKKGRLLSKTVLKKITSK